MNIVKLINIVIMFKIKSSPNFVIYSQLTEQLNRLIIISLRQSKPNVNRVTLRWLNNIKQVDVQAQIYH